MKSSNKVIAHDPNLDLRYGAMLIRHLTLQVAEISPRAHCKGRSIDAASPKREVRSIRPLDPRKSKAYPGLLPYPTSAENTSYIG
jgi:hypothetical protein